MTISRNNKKKKEKRTYLHDLPFMYIHFSLFVQCNCASNYLPPILSVAVSIAAANAAMTIFFQKRQSIAFLVEKMKNFVLNLLRSLENFLWKEIKIILKIET